MDPHLAAAHQQAVQSLEEGGFPVGSVIVKDGQVIGAGFNRYTQTGDPTTHAEIEAMRLGETVFDPYVAILNAKRFELSASDDSALLRQDGVAQAVLPEDGRYIVEVRESAYGGAGNCRYRVHVGTFPRPRALLPAGGKRGTEVEVQYLADVNGAKAKKVQLPAETNPAFGL